MYCLFWAKAGATLRSGRFPKAYTVCFHTNMVSSFHPDFFINMVDVFFNCMAYQKVNINYISFISLKLKYLMIGNTLLYIWNKSKYQLAIDCSTQYDQRSMSLPIYWKHWTHGLNGRLLNIDCSLQLRVAYLPSMWTHITGVSMFCSKSDILVR